MPARHPPLSAAGLVADPLPQNGSKPRNRPAVTERIWLAPDVPDAIEKGLRRRARRQGLALMVASSFVSILALYGAWWLLHGLL
jgi:hypothetical protein